MAQQGLFTQLPSVDELLQQRNKRATDLQQTLMNNAAQGARDPAKARAVSFLGSALGRALGDSMGGEDEQMSKRKAAIEEQKRLQGEFGSVMQGTPEQRLAFGNSLLTTRYATEGAQILVQARKDIKDRDDAATKKREDQLAIDIANEDDFIKAEEDNKQLQNNAVVLSKGLKTYAPAVYEALNSDNATAQTLTQGYMAQSELRKIKYDEANGTTKDSKLSFTEAGSFADLQGNMYVATKSVGPKGGAKIIYTGIGDAPEYTTGTKLKPLNSNNMTLEQQVQLKGEQAAATQQAKDWSDTMTTARDNRISLQDSEYFINKAIRLLPKIGKTGSVVTKLTKEATDFWGVTSADIGEFDQLSAKTALGQLKTTFGASPTEGERAILFSIQANINNNQGLNTRILESAKEMVEWRIRANKAALSDRTASGSSYNDWLLDDANGPPRYTPETEKSENTAPKVMRVFGEQPVASTTNWGDLDE